MQKRGDRLGPRGLINRAEYVRLIEQALATLGYNDLASKLEEASGIQMQPPQVSLFQAHVMEGRWEEALKLLPQLASRPEVLRDAKFLVLQQKYVEALEAGDTSVAIACLRKEMSPLGVNPNQLHRLAALLMHPPSLDASSPNEWLSKLGGGRDKREIVLLKLQSLLPPNLMLPQARLEALIEQALQAQVSSCKYHNVMEAHLTLLTDYQAGVDSLPTKLVQVIDVHSDEVWHVCFSNNGTMLASASKDKSAIIWSVKTLSPSQQHVLVPVHTLQEHLQPVAFLSWSPDDTMLLTCSDDLLRLYDVATGQLLYCFTQHRETVTSCAWLPDSKRFLSGSVDKTILMFDVNGNELQRWKRMYRIQDMAVSPDGAFVFIASNDRQLHVLRLSDQREIMIQETAPITSITLAPHATPPPSHSDSPAPNTPELQAASGTFSSNTALCSIDEAPPGYLLVNLQGHAVHLWDFGSLMLPPGSMNPDLDPMDQPPSEPIKSFLVNGGRPGRYVLRSSFGGTCSNFVVHGSEDCKVYVWHRDTEQLLMHLEGHSGTVNSVSWNPANPHMLATASDDKTIRVWMAPRALPPGFNSGEGRQGIGPSAVSSGHSLVGLGEAVLAARKPAVPS
ncbi:hypothetical protein CEUSTIGMA_g8716.t1 [Chlamydomonas eustigma]|uniref:CTLH domain-containing protein n=1 Tax=Chlamydomonas eustigma TaxID=1157962 RepID=A0A250XDY4_9CHLO|nr:hypothetical protein CEUSTIGMA_g8716.t1 [Chlamydomonas eustigma]|eukprot:GAX81284.1 hypothetical protein CEUSTIGMA_g8716.t1 [Chlamydomonas eustigma]